MNRHLKNLFLNEYMVQKNPFNPSLLIPFMYLMIQLDINMTL